MNIAVLSGKGGAGKTVVSVNLALAAGKSCYVDCDIEEPNGGLFFKAEQLTEEAVTVWVPNVNMELCTACGVCAQTCLFNALAVFNGKWMFFPEVCHSCGGCRIVCPNQAITEIPRAIGSIEKSKKGQVDIYSGVLNIGEASGVPIIKQLLKGVPHNQTVVIDCPPGSSCSVMESIADSDYCVLVTEPTRFGVHNLKMIHELVNLMQKPCGVIINKHIEGERIAHEYCQTVGLPILAEIPYSQQTAYMLSEGKLLVEEDAQFRSLFENLLLQIQGEVEQ